MKKLSLICFLILMGTIKFSSAMMVLDKGKYALSSSSRVLPYRTLQVSFFTKLIPVDSRDLPLSASKVLQFAYVGGKGVVSPFVSKEVNYRKNDAHIRHFLAQKLYPLKFPYDIHTPEDFIFVKNDTNSYIQRMTQYPKNSWLYKVEKKRLEGLYLTFDFLFYSEGDEVKTEYQHYIISLVVKHDLELTTQEDVIKLFDRTLNRLTFFKDEQEKNFFRYCGINTHAWHDVQWQNAAKLLSLAYDLCDPAMPQKYKIPESQFEMMLANCSLRINQEAKWLMSKAYDTFVLTDEQMFQKAKREENCLEENSLTELMVNAINEQENQSDDVASAHFPFYSKELEWQLQEIQYERDRMLSHLTLLSERYYK